MMDISILIVNYNTAELVKRCILSILNQRDVDFEIIVVDNASSDNSVEILGTFESRITLIKNKANVGFGRANNQAANVSTGNYLFCLNPDAMLLKDNDLYELLEFMIKHPQCGLVGTRIIDGYGHYTKSVRHNYLYHKSARIDFSILPGDIAWVTGASMIIHHPLFKKLQGFDEDFFMYAEEVDLCLRVRRFGYEIGYCDTVTVQHIGGASEVKNALKDRVIRHKTGVYQFCRKHYQQAGLNRVLQKDLRTVRRKLFFLTLKNKLLKLTPAEQCKYIKYQAIKIAVMNAENGVIFTVR